MLKRLFAFSFLTLTLLPFTFVLAQGSKASKGPDSKTVDQRFDIMREDENEDTDTLAIPLDDSAVEDEEELDYIEGKPFKVEAPARENSRNDTPSQKSK